MSVLVHHPIAVKSGRGWAVECTCGRDDLNLARITSKAVASRHCAAHTRVVLATGGAVTRAAADAAQIYQRRITDDGYAVRL